MKYREGIWSMQKTCYDAALTTGNDALVRGYDPPGKTVCGDKRPQNKVSEKQTYYIETTAATSYVEENQQNITARAV